MPNIPDMREVAPDAIIREVHARGEPFAQAVLASYTPTFLARHLMARTNGLRGALPLLPPADLRTFAMRQYQEHIDANAPSGPWDSERDRSRAIQRTVEQWPESMALVALATGCDCDSESIRAALETSLDRATDSYSEEDEDDGEPVRNRETGALPGRSDGPEWSTTA